MNDSRPSHEADAPAHAQSATPTSKPLFKNIAYFLGSMGAAYVIIQVVKLFVHPWLVTNGLWPF